MRDPTRAEMAAVRVAVREALGAANAQSPLTDPHQVVVAHYVGNSHTPGTPWPCMDAVLVICDHGRATALVAAIAVVLRDDGDVVDEDA